MHGSVWIGWIVPSFVWVWMIRLHTYGGCIMWQA